jgi:hypothetical protein
VVQPILAIGRYPSHCPGPKSREFALVQHMLGRYYNILTNVILDLSPTRAASRSPHTSQLVVPTAIIMARLLDGTPSRQD